MNDKVNMIIYKNGTFITTSNITAKHMIFKELTTRLTDTINNLEILSMSIIMNTQGVTFIKQY